ncbi:hypothetical protein CERZMDRAFT_37620 [Cercospora zeae-maydis SCOH1-5]|uniref:Uncharacterized protein n=1 Tax=Cercospora zeae-maydis SCOH1-5 TaxID=717836 RepID=A0A6A6FLY6_9PEZI|nr:hypothetical protein CERZMDRAFT_37620 [Cercospora zeae-maydis SCOH1-5]
MPFTDTVSTLSGRNSRASNVSGQSRSQHRSPPTSTNEPWSNAGVLSMLKTSTDTGDIGALSFNSSRLPGMPSARHRGRPSNTSKQSASGHPHITSLSSNHSYAPSQTSRVSSQWDNASMTQRRGSLTSMQSMPPSLPPLHPGKPAIPMQQPLQDLDPRDSRSYSIGSAVPNGQLPRLRSAASLKSQGHEPRHMNAMPPGPVPPLPENRSPFVYPTRLKRPGFRSPSPALSDSFAGPQMGVPQMPRRAHGPQPPPMTAYNGYNAPYMMDYSNPQTSMRGPPRTADSSPGPTYAPTQYGYQQGSMRPPPPMAMPPPMSQPYSQHYPLQPVGAQMPPRAHYGSQYPPGYAYPPYGQAPPHTRARGPPPPANVGPMAHHMFHNAARMARNLPHRTDTPMTDGGPPSSDPASASSAQDSSSPPTPRDATMVRVVVDPAFIEPELLDLPDSSEPMMPGHKYFEYAEGGEDKHTEVPHASIPPSGFVQRVKAMLESKAALEATQQNDHEKAMQLVHPMQIYRHELDVENEQEGEVSDLELHEMAANETPRFTIIEEFEAPVELPASPVKVPELDATEVNTRITRDMIRAELSCISTADNTLEQAQPDESTANVIKQLVERGDEQEPSSVSEHARPEAAPYTHSRRSSRQSAVSARRRQVVHEPITEASMEASLPSAADYAMQFQAPVDTTESSDETQSRDPFALDADTVTLQHQAAAAKEVTRTDQLEDGKKTPGIDAARQSVFLDLTPVSPLKPGEEVKRCSAVSPVHEDPRGIDETLHVAGNDTEREPQPTGLQEVSTVDSRVAESNFVPPTPRTPRTYSKSVQIHRPSPQSTDGTNTNSNRFSLPGDLSTVGDTTLQSASDMVTDVAVRFSLPGTTVTVGKPQIIEVSPRSTPDKPKEESHNFQPHFTKQAGLRPSRRNSVTFADEIAPLNIKKSEPARSEASSSQHKSIIRKPAHRDDAHQSLKSSRDSAADISSNFTHASHARFGSAHLRQLPGLKEESIEDLSSPEKKRGTSHAEFALPARIAAVKAMQERRLQDSGDKSKARRAAQKHNRPLGDTRDLPSLNFSRTDLFEKLNDALEVRPVKSMDVIRRRDFSGIHCPSPQRPMSTEPLRDRYASFFNKPEDFSFFEEVDSSDDEAESEADDTVDNSKALVPVVKVQENTQVENEEPANDNRPLSPEDFLHVAHQASRLSIPSVAGLSERLSELIPGLRNLSNLRLDSLLSSDNTPPVGSLCNEFGRPETVLTNRTSAGFRTLAERAEEIVVNGTHDSAAPCALHALLLNKDLPPLPGSASADEFSGINSVVGKSSYLSGSVSVPIDLGKDVSRPVSALLRTRAPTTEQEVQELLPKGMNPLARLGNRRSAVLSQPNSRPWNVDKNYPWSGNKIEIDLSVPSPAHTRTSFASDVLRERKTRSLDLPSSSRSPTGSKGIDIGSITASPAGSRFSVTTEQLTGVNTAHPRHKSKRSIIGSISKKFGITSGRNTTLDDIASRSLPGSPVPRQASVLSHKPGDRYPTSSLTPPAIAALDEVRSFFSDNSSERHRTASFRKRLTQFKGKNKTPRIELHPARTAHSLDLQGNTEYSAGSVNEARSESAAMHLQYDAAGMGKAEFHFKRFGEKLRHFFHRGGELFRSISTRGRPRKNEPRDEWLADSLYSGV